MAGRTPHEALEAFIGPLQQSLSCITDAVLDTHKRGNKEYPNRESYSITTNAGKPADLLCDNGLSLSFIMWYRVVKDDADRDPWRATTTGYYYSLDDSNQKEIVAYHWHPTISDIDFPHLYIEQGSGVTRKELFRAHLPTGRIALEDMIWCTIRDFSIQVLRDDWVGVLTRNRDAFRTLQTWS